MSRWATRRSAVLLGGCFLFSAACSADVSPDPVSTVSGAIFNGTSTWDPNVVALTTGQARAVGSVLLRGNNDSFENNCTATLVAPDVVLTAAHCVVPGQQSNVEVAANVQFAVGANVAFPDSVHTVSSVTAHPDYDPNGDTAINDIAVLKLVQPASATAVGELTPIPVSCEPLVASELVGDMIQSVGYGATNAAGDAWTTLQGWIPMEVVDLTSIDLSINGMGDGGVCFGDSGGPALWTMPDGVVRIIGVLSWGDAMCGRSDYYVRTDNECDFIAPFLPDGNETGTGGTDGNETDTGGTDGNETDTGGTDGQTDGVVGDAATVLVRGGGCQGSGPVGVVWWLALAVGPVMRRFRWVGA